MRLTVCHKEPDRMLKRQLTGGRIRERRIALAMRQVDLARQVGISASYLNLIEHDRRRIGGKLLLDLSAVLGVEPSALTEGAEAALIATLREAASAAPQAGAEIDAMEDFAARFSGWARLLADRHRRVLALERTVEQLADRLTHDPYIAASMHEVLSSVTAIRATAGILVDPREIEPEWRDRFHRNLNEDATRLARSAQALVSYLDGAGRADAALSAPQDELEQFLSGHAYHFPALEAGADMPDAVIDALIDADEALQSASARAQARSHLERYHADAVRLPLARLQAAQAEFAGTEEVCDPLVLAQHLGVDAATAMRRLACLPMDEAAGAPLVTTHVPPHGPIGLVSCDASGTLLLRRPIEGFALPRFGAACPRWPLFAALSRPMTPIRQTLRQSGPDGQMFRAYAIAQPVGRVAYNADPMFEAHMMILPLSPLPLPLPVDRAGPDKAGSDRSGAENGTVREVGVSCRICPAQACEGRREPSILADGF
ncbi:MAG: short-chain fatty acyl-CoA regulator family protein [Rhodobacterales bacterium]